MNACALLAGIRDPTVSPPPAKEATEGGEISSDSDATAAKDEYENAVVVATPKNPVIEECLSAMLTPYVVSLMRDGSYLEVLKILNSNTENPYMIWDNGTRAELTDFLENERTSSIRRGTCDPTFGASFQFSSHENELIVGDIFVRIYNEQPMFQLKEPKRFAVDLLEFLNGQAQYLYSLLAIAADSTGQPTSQKLEQSEMALEALSNVIKHNNGMSYTKYKSFFTNLLSIIKLFAGVEIQCIGHFKLLFCLLRLDHCLSLIHI